MRNIPARFRKSCRWLYWLKGVSLNELDRPGEALEAWDETVRRFGMTQDPRLQGNVARALVGKGLSLLQLNRSDEAVEVWAEVERRFGTSDLPDLGDMVEIVLVGKAALEFAKGQAGAAIATIDSVFHSAGAGSPERNWPAHQIRARAHFVEGNVAAGVRDVEAMLAILPNLDALPKGALNGLSEIAVALGSEKMRDLIRASPAADLLLPLTTALEMELGEEPRVAKEVEEVAEDIRRDLAERREARRG